MTNNFSTFLLPRASTKESKSVERSSAIGDGTAVRLKQMLFLGRRGNLTFLVYIIAVYWKVGVQIAYRVISLIFVLFLLPPGTKERAIIHALASAGVVHVVAQSCYAGNLTACGMCPGNGLSNTQFQWGICTTNMIVSYCYITWHGNLVTW